jgi:hypothetical protein
VEATQNTTPQETSPPEATEPVVLDGKFNDPRAAAVAAVKNGSQDPADVSDATEWFLSDANSEPVEKTFLLNVGTEEAPTLIEWTVQAISREKLRTIRRMSRPASKRAQRDGEIDEIAANTGIAAAGTVFPDLNEMAAAVGAPSTTAVLEARMKHKPGLIDQIAGEVLSVSGYGENDLRDLSAVKP